MALSAILLRTTVITMVGALGVLGLSGCVQDPSDPSSGGSSKPHASHSGSASPSSGSSSSASPGASASPSTSPVASGTPVTVTCPSLISGQAMYDYNPNFTLKSDYSAPSGSLGAKARSFKGIACGWINQTSSEIIAVSIARPSAADLVTLKSAAGTGTTVAGLGDAAWFAKKSGAGEFQIFSGSFWITASSALWAPSDDVRALLANVVGNAK
jgi:hypothetical protein